uniref:Uncharacterized protein n=1 Tax=Cacopsylla melanoneura TaxID=428564 RepID=A0A8D8T1R2_9HEMI
MKLTHYFLFVALCALSIAHAEDNKDNTTTTKYHAKYTSGNSEETRTILLYEIEKFKLSLSYTRGLQIETTNKEFYKLKIKQPKLSKKITSAATENPTASNELDSNSDNVNIKEPATPTNGSLTDGDGVVITDNSTNTTPSTTIFSVSIKCGFEVFKNFSGGVDKLVIADGSICIYGRDILTKDLNENEVVTITISFTVNGKVSFNIDTWEVIIETTPTVEVVITEKIVETYKQNNISYEDCRSTIKKLVFKAIIEFRFTIPKPIRSKQPATTTNATLVLEPTTEDLQDYNFADEDYLSPSQLRRNNQPVCLKDQHVRVFDGENE